MDELDELSIAQAIVDAAAHRANGRRVAMIEVMLGERCGLARDSLELAFSLVTSGTALDGAELAIERVSGGELVVDAVEFEREPARSQWLDHGSHV
jgi:Zn finger protein HypA/HybF involved in hydrogenase expression